jgi:hypothetical protein
MYIFFLGRDTALTVSGGIAHVKNKEAASVQSGLKSIV